MERKTNKKQNNGLSTPRKPSSKRKGLGLIITYAVVLLIVIVAAVTLCVFVFFNVNEINIQGNTVYDEANIISALEINEGDNLFFADTDLAEKNIVTKFPYVESVKVKKKLPSTVSVEIVEATVLYSVEYNDKYIYVSPGGKILEISLEPRNDSVLLIGGEFQEYEGKLIFTDDKIYEMFVEISSVLRERENLSITQINISDPYEITMIYDDRVTMKLGNSNDLTYKLNFGLQIISNSGIKPDERGTLDVSMAKDINKAYFSQEITQSVPENTTSELNNSEDTSLSEEPKDNTESEPENSNSGTPSRGSDIPDF